jgi:DNA repair ATPase RecN
LTIQQDIVKRIELLEKAVNELDHSKVDRDEYNKLRDLVQDLKEKIAINTNRIDNIDEIMLKIDKSVISIAANVEERIFKLHEKVLKWVGIIAASLIFILLGIKVIDVLGLLKLL